MKYPPPPSPSRPWILTLDFRLRTPSRNHGGEKLVWEGTGSVTGECWVECVCVCACVCVCERERINCTSYQIKLFKIESSWENLQRDKLKTMFQLLKAHFLSLSTIFFQDKGQEIIENLWCHTLIVGFKFFFFPSKRLCKAWMYLYKATIKHLSRDFPNHCNEK